MEDFLGGVGDVCGTSPRYSFLFGAAAKRKKNTLRRAQTELGGAARCTGPYASTEGRVWKHGGSLAELKMKHRWKIENDNE